MQHLILQAKAIFLQGTVISYMILLNSQPLVLVCLYLVLKTPREVFHVPIQSSAVPILPILSELAEATPHPGLLSWITTHALNLDPFSYN